MALKIDFNHWRGSEIADEIQKQQYLERGLSILKALNPTFSRKGNQWMYLYGKLPNDCIVGFGNTPHDAMSDFANNFFTAQAK